MCYYTKMALNIMTPYVIKDDYLTENPQVTFFKLKYRHHSNFVCTDIHTEYFNKIKNNDVIMIHKNEKYNSSIFNCRYKSNII
jgi:hypothetical protein